MQCDPQHRRGLKHKLWLGGNGNGLGTQRTWVQLPLVPMRVVGGGSNGIQPKFLPFANKSKNNSDNEKTAQRDVNTARWP